MRPNLPMPRPLVGAIKSPPSPAHMPGHANHIDRPGPKHPAPHREMNITSTTISGVISRYLVNPEGEVDGLLLENGEQLHCPPHLGDALRQCTEIGEQIEAIVEPGISSWNGQTFRILSLINTETGQAIVDKPPMHHVPPHLARQQVGVKGIHFDSFLLHAVISIIMCLVRA